MTQYVDSEYRQVDGGNYNKLWHPVPLETLREIASNAIPNIAANGGLLASDTTPILQLVNGDSDSALSLAWAAANVDAVAFSVPLPPWLDTSEDIVIRFHAAMANTNDTPTVASDVFFDKGDTKVEDVSAAVTGATAADYTITVGNGDIPIGARVMNVELTPGTHGTDIAYVYSIGVELKVLP